jgi:hypothetical protein
MLLDRRLMGIALGLMAALSVVTLHSQSHAEESTLISIGPRIGFSSVTPLLGKQQKESFRLYDVAALFRLPWQWPLGRDSWNLGTGVIVSAGVLEGAGTVGLIATVIPDLILSSPNGIISFDAGAGVAGFSRHQFGVQDFGGPAQIVATIGMTYSPFTHSYAAFRLQHFSDASLYGSDALGVDMYIFEVGYKF